MKFSGIIFLLISLLVINLVSGHYLKKNKRELIDFDIDDDDRDVRKSSEECKAEVQKSLTCLRKIEEDINSLEDFLENLNITDVCNPSVKTSTADNCKVVVKQGLDAVCDVFAEDVCIDFIAENHVVNLINSAKCEKNEYELTLLAKLAAAKGVYLMGCNKSDSGNYCPLTQYATTSAIDFVFNNYKTINRLGENRYDRENNNELEGALDFGNDILTLVPVLKDLNKILVDSCSDASCNKNILALDKIVLAAKAAYEKNQKTDLTAKFPKIFEYYESYLSKYRNKECKLVSFSSDTSDTTTIKKITYSLVTMMAASVLLLL